MSEIYSHGSKEGLQVFLNDGIGDESIDRAYKVLAGIKHGAEKAIGSAMKRAAKSGEAYAAKAVRDEYIIDAASFKKYTKSKIRYISENGSLTAEIEYRGFHIPLIKFDSRFGKDGRVTVRVRRSSSRTTLDNVFSSNVGKGHFGLFERVGEKRLPIEEKFGPSTPQMMESNDDIAQAIGDRVREAFDNRIEHEIDAVLNGWRK